MNITDIEQEIRDAHHSININRDLINGYNDTIDEARTRFYDIQRKYNSLIEERRANIKILNKEIDSKNTELRNAKSSQYKIGDRFEMVEGELFAGCVYMLVKNENGLYAILNTTTGNQYAIYTKDISKVLGGNDHAFKRL